MPKCAALHNHLCFFLNKEIEYRPCCVFKNDEYSFPIKEMSITQYRNTDYFRSIKTQMEKNWHHGCRTCKDDEHSGIASVRNFYNSQLSGENEDITFLEIALSNQCNITCKMCNQKSSNKWQYLIDTNPKIEKWFDPIKPDFSSANIQSIFNDIDINKVDKIKYLGGEPFVTKELYELISFLCEKNLANNITLFINTNATLFPIKIIDQLKKFKSVVVDISIDGLDDLCNYIRTGFDWKVVSTNINKWIELRNSDNKFYLAGTYTAQAYNLHQDALIRQFAKECNIQLWLNPLHGPEFLSYKALPIEYRQNLINSGILNDPETISVLNKNDFDKELFDKFKEFTYTMDNILNTSIQETIPDLFDYFKS